MVLLGVVLFFWFSLFFFPWGFSTFPKRWIHDVLFTDSCCTLQIEWLSQGGSFSTGKKVFMVLWHFVFFLIVVRFGIVFSFRQFFFSTTVCFFVTVGHVVSGS